MTKRRGAEVGRRDQAALSQSVAQATRVEAALTALTLSSQECALFLARRVGEAPFGALVPGDLSRSEDIVLPYDVAEELEMDAKRLLEGQPT